jgi:hypothetical protein
VPQQAATAATQGAASPVQAVIRFYTLAAEHKFDQAVQLWSPAMQTAYPPAENINSRFADTRSIYVTSSSVVAQDPASGRATVAVDLVETTGTPPSTRRWTGTWDVVNSPTGWLLDQPHF